MDITDKAKKEIGAKIRELRIGLGMSQEELAKAVGYTSENSRSTVNKVEMGNNDVTYTKLILYANALKTTVPDLLGLNEYQNTFHIFQAKNLDEFKNKSKVCIIPVLGRVVAGIPTDAVEEIIDYEEISEAMASQGEFFALQVKGDSMSPKFTAGDVVIVRKQEDVDNGDIAIMLINGDEATIKRVQKFNGGINLIPTNQAYPVLTYTNKEIEELPVRCLGKVVELRAKF